MHRIDTSTATSDGKFTEGDPTVPVPATTVSADWLNAVQEELVAAIASAGLEPDKSDNTQLRQAIGKLISAAVDAARIHPATVAPKAPGTAAVGTSPKFAREDHVHPEQTSVSGNAGSATKLAAPRTILVNLGATASASFDGTKNITPGVSGILPVACGGTGRKDGKAVALATARTITLTGDVSGSASFDGSKNVSINVTVSGLEGGVPIGGILPFSGTFGGTGNRFPIPLGGSAPLTNWCLCDGVTTNGKPVPDLRDRMIMGAGTTYKTGSKGGAATHLHTVSGTVGATTLTVAQLAKHDHKMFADANATYRLPANEYCCVQCSYNGYLYDGNYGIGGTTTKPSLGKSGDVGTSASHTHSLTGVKSGSASSLPPYYALAFIMRVA